MLTSKVWILAPDSGQPQVHRDQSTCKYSCPGPQVESRGVPGPRASLTPIVSPGRSLPDPAQDPDPAAGQTPGHAAWPGPLGHRALNLHEHLAAIASKTPPSCQLRPGQVSPARPPPSPSRHPVLLGSQSPERLCYCLGFRLSIVSSGVFVYLPHCLPPGQVSA